MEPEQAEIEGRILRMEDDGYVFMETKDGQRRAFGLDKRSLAGKKVGDKISFRASMMSDSERERGEESARVTLRERYDRILEERDQARESGEIIHPTRGRVPFTPEVAAEVEEALNWGHATLRNPFMTKIEERRQARLARERAESE
jgi:hypothetical protein